MMRKKQSNTVRLDSETIAQLDQLRISLENIDRETISSIDQYAKFSGYLRHEDLHTRFTR
jgi:hypothetical protein